MPGMSESRKKSRWMFLTFVTLVLTVANPLSILPLDWLVKRSLLPPAAMQYWIFAYSISVPAIFLAVCLWLTVRVLNRGERWAKWSLGITLGLPILYLASWPIMALLWNWLHRHGIFFPEELEGVIAMVFLPADLTVDESAPAWLRDMMTWYLGIWNSFAS
jgi:hypothetical protein